LSGARQGYMPPRLKTNKQISRKNHKQILVPTGQKFGFVVLEFIFGSGEQVYITRYFEKEKEMTHKIE
jgi:hypothetical protein